MFKKIVLAMVASTVLMTPVLAQNAQFIYRHSGGLLKMAALEGSGPKVTIEIYKDQPSRGELPWNLLPGEKYSVNFEAFSTTELSVPLSNLNVNFTPFDRIVKAKCSVNEYSNQSQLCNAEIILSATDSAKLYESDSRDTIIGYEISHQNKVLTKVAEYFPLYFAEGWETEILERPVFTAVVNEFGDVETFKASFNIKNNSLFPLTKHDFTVEYVYGAELTCENISIKPGETVKCEGSTTLSSDFINHSGWGGVEIDVNPNITAQGLGAAFHIYYENTPIRVKFPAPNGSS